MIRSGLATSDRGGVSSARRNSARRAPSEPTPTPTLLTVPDEVDLRKVDLSIELQILSFHEHRKAVSAGVGS